MNSLGSTLHVVSTIEVFAKQRNKRKVLFRFFFCNSQMPDFIGIHFLSRLYSGFFFTPSQFKEYLTSVLSLMYNNIWINQNYVIPE